MVTMTTNYITMTTKFTSIKSNWKIAEVSRDGRIKKSTNTSGGDKNNATLYLIFKYSM